MLVPPFRVVLKTPVDSALHLSITMASADFCAFSTAFGSGYVFRRLPHRPPWVPHVSFTPSTCLIYPMRFRVAIGLYLALQTYPRMRPYMRFLFVRPELCPRVSRFPESSFLQILPRDRHPCLRLCPSRYRVDSGLTPVRNVRRQAHNRKNRAHMTPCFRVLICIYASGFPDTERFRSFVYRFYELQQQGCRNL